MKVYDCTGDSEQSFEKISIRPEVHSDMEQEQLVVVQLLHVTAAKDATEKIDKTSRKEETAMMFFFNMISSSMLSILTMQLGPCGLIRGMPSMTQDSYLEIPNS